MKKALLLTSLLLGFSLQVGAQTLINAAGATFPYPIYSKWFDAYHNEHSNIQINYQSIGSGGGIRQVTEGTVDFGASDGPMTDEQLKEFEQKRGTKLLTFQPSLVRWFRPTTSKVCPAT